MLACSRRKLVVSILVIAVLAVGTLIVAPDVLAHSPHSQIRFYAGGNGCSSPGCLIRSLEITGTNQYNQVVTWRSGILTNWVFSIPIYNWWWKPNAGVMVKVDFGNDSRGVLTCRVPGVPYQTPDGYATWWHIRYTGE